MPCCGQKRRHMSRQNHSRLPHRSNPDNQTPANRLGILSQQRVSEGKTPVTLIYGGSSRLVVIGPFTHRRYVFTSSEPEVKVDYRDVASLLQLKQLTRAKASTP